VGGGDEGRHSYRERFPDRAKGAKASSGRWVESSLWKERDWGGKAGRENGGLLPEKKKEKKVKGREMGEKKRSKKKDRNAFRVCNNELKKTIPIRKESQMGRSDQYIQHVKDKKGKTL